MQRDEVAAVLTDHVGHKAGHVAAGGKGVGAVCNVIPREFAQQGAECPVQAGQVCPRGAVGAQVHGVNAGGGVIAGVCQFDGAFAGGGVCRPPDGQAHGVDAAYLRQGVAQDVAGEYLHDLGFAEALYLAVHGLCLAEADELLYPAGEAVGIHVFYLGHVVGVALGICLCLVGYGDYSAVVKPQCPAWYVGGHGACQLGDGPLGVDAGEPAR